MGAKTENRLWVETPHKGAQDAGLRVGGLCLESVWHQALHFTLSFDLRLTTLSDPAVTAMFCVVLGAIPYSGDKREKRRRLTLVPLCPPPPPSPPLPPSPFPPSAAAAYTECAGQC